MFAGGVVSGPAPIETKRGVDRPFLSSSCRLRVGVRGAPQKGDLVTYSVVSRVRPPPCDSSGAAARASVRARKTKLIAEVGGGGREEAGGVRGRQGGKDVEYRNVKNDMSRDVGCLVTPSCC